MAAKPTELEMRVVFTKGHTLGELTISGVAALEALYGQGRIPQEAIDVHWFQEQLASVGIEVRVAKP